MNSPLFRPEVIAAQQAQWLGSIRLTRPIPFAVVTSVGVLLATLLITFLVVGEYTRKVRVNGTLQPTAGALRLVTPTSGVISDMHVKEGSTVKEGEVLFVISSEKQTSAGDTQAALSRQINLRRESMEAERKHAKRKNKIASLLSPLVLPRSMPKLIN
jgi:membrane fusion protein